MATLRSDSAVAAANQIIGMMQTMKAFRAQMNDYVTAYGEEGDSALWGAMATAALNADGTLGTADGTPNTAHPIDTRLAAYSNLQRAASQAALVAGVNLLTNLQKFLTGTAPTVGIYNQAIDDLAS